MLSFQSICATFVVCELSAHSHNDVMQKWPRHFLNSLMVLAQKSCRNDRCQFWALWSFSHTGTPQIDPIMVNKTWSRLVGYLAMHDGLCIRWLMFGPPCRRHLRWGRHAASEMSTPCRRHLRWVPHAGDIWDESAMRDSGCSMNTNDRVSMSECLTHARTTSCYRFKASVQLLYFVSSLLILTTMRCSLLNSLMVLAQKSCRNDRGHFWDLRSVSHTSTSAVKSDCAWSMLW
jgi:hypothetical protein